MGERWKDTAPLMDPDVITELGKKYGITIHESFKNFIMQYNGGCISPHPYIYNPVSQHGAMFSDVISFNDTDPDNVFDYIEMIADDNGNIPFIPFGHSKSGIFGINGGLVLIRDSESSEIFNVSESLSTFLCRVT